MEAAQKRIDISFHFCYNRKMRTIHTFKRRKTVILIAVVFLLAGIGWLWTRAGSPKVSYPPYAGEPYVQLSEEPSFKASEITKRSYESYSRLDRLGRCGPAMACIGQDLMPTEPRGSISGVKPSGWNQAKYPGIIEDDPPYLYNRCHLIAYQLSGENANERNLITGTRYFNVTGMQPWEDQVASYVRRTGNHVMYRVTPVFEGREKVARGVRMEAFSVEDRGQGICFDIFVYNVQPGVRIEYSTGNSTLE